MDQIHLLGSLALGSRLKRLSDRFMTEGAEIYKAAAVPFEPRWFPLFSLLAERGPLAIGEAAEALGLSHAAVSQTARGMVERGVLSTAKDRGDERRTKIELSAAGRALIPRLRPLWDAIRAAVDELSQATGTDVLSTLSRLERAMDTENLAERTARRLAVAALGAVEILEYAPRFKDHFRALNTEWIERFFVLERADEELFADPEGLILRPGGAILFAAVAGEVVGTVALLRRDAGRVELAKMAVSPAAQGRQIGKKLMLAALAKARTLGATSVYLETNDALTPAVNLYRRVGFTPDPNAPAGKYARVNLTMSLSL